MQPAQATPDRPATVAPRPPTAPEPAPRPAPTPGPAGTTPVPPALPKGIDFFRFLIFAGETLALLSILVFLAPDQFGRLISDPPLTIMVLLGLLGCIPLIVWTRPWTYLTAGIAVSLYPLAGLALFMIHLLLNPLEGRNFIGSIVALGAMLLALPAGINGFRHARRAEHVTITRGRRTAQGTFAYAVVFLMLGAIYAGGLASSMAKSAGAGSVDFTAADVGGETASLTMVEFEFAPDSLTITPGKVTALHIKNEDSTVHTFTYEKDGREYNHQLLGDTESTVWLLFQETGTVKFRCVPHSSDYDAGMVGVINVSL